MKKLKVNVSSPILYIILGLLLMIFKIDMLQWAITIAGVFFALLGVLDIVGKRLTSGIMNIALGAIILLVGWLVLEIVLIVLGILIAVKGIMDLVEILKSNNKNALSVVFAVLTVAIGIALAMGKLLGNLIWIIGLLLVIDGALGLSGGILALVRSKNKK